MPSLTLTLTHRFVYSPLCTFGCPHVPMLPIEAVSCCLLEALGAELIGNHLRGQVPQSHPHRLVLQSPPQLEATQRSAAGSACALCPLPTSTCPAAVWDSERHVGF